jgi:hypothetical protein
MPGPGYAGLCGTALAAEQLTGPAAGAHPAADDAKPEEGAAPARPSNDHMV